MNRPAIKPFVPYQDRVPEYEPTYTNDRYIEEARARYDAKHGEGAWQRKVDAEWEAAR